MRIRVTGIIPWKPEEWSGYENALRSRSLRNGGGISEPRCALRSCENGARCRIQTLGRTFALSDSRNGRCDGLGEIVAEYSGVNRRHYRFAHRRDRRIRSIMGSLSIDRARKAYRLENGAGIVPDHVRDDRALRRLRRVFFGPDHEWIAPAASPAF